MMDLITYVLAYKSENFGQFSPQKSGVDLYAGHKKVMLVDEL